MGERGGKPPGGGELHPSSCELEVLLLRRGKASDPTGFRTAAQKRRAKD